MTYSQQERVPVHALSRPLAAVVMLVTHIGSASMISTTRSTACCKASQL
jgi:hypothetical protein